MKLDRRISAEAIALCWSSTIVYYVPLIRPDNSRYDHRYRMQFVLQTRHDFGSYPPRWDAMSEVFKLQTSKVICYDMITALRQLLEAGIRGTPDSLL